MLTLRPDSSSVFMERLTEVLFPHSDNVYHHNSGGSPEQIPFLTHEALVDFHRVCYNPSNAFLAPTARSAPNSKSLMKFCYAPD